MEISETNQVAASFSRSDSRGVSTTQHPFGERNMFTSLTETNPASEYRNPPSRSSVFNGFSINDDRYLVSRILADQESILWISKFEAIEQITSAYADRHIDTLSNCDKCDRRFANKESYGIINHAVAIAFLISRNRVYYRFGGL